MFDEYIKAEVAQKLFPRSPKDLYYLIQDIASTLRYLHSVGISYGQEINNKSFLWTKSSQVKMTLPNYL